MKITLLSLSLKDFRKPTILNDIIWLRLDLELKKS